MIEREETYDGRQFTMIEAEQGRTLVRIADELDCGELRILGMEYHLPGAPFQELPEHFREEASK